MWPFKKRPKPAPNLTDSMVIGFTQLDITERFDDHLTLQPDQWIATTPLNATNPNPAQMGLPDRSATPDQVFAMASKLSKVRESLPLSNDGVYCPICHIANTQLSRLRTPCPKCGRELLKFGWD